VKYFTNSPYERMMMQRPKERREETPPAALPPSHPCFGCDRYKNGCCAGPCYRDLIITPKRKEAEKCDL
jgi:hypothetical protein